MSDLRVVLDANVVVSAILFQIPHPGESYCRRASILSLVSTELVKKMVSVLLRPKLDRFVPKERRLEVLGNYLTQCVLVTVQTTVTACRDANDNHPLALAIDGQADAIVTGDRDLLEMGAFEGILIQTPADFLANPATSGNGAELA